MTLCQSSKNELLRLVEADDRYGLFLLAGRRWLAKDHPEAEYAVAVVEVGDGFPALTVPIIPAEVSSV